MSTRQNVPCTGDLNCEASLHIHGCLADFGGCDSPEEHRTHLDFSSHTPLSMAPSWSAR